jgi:hypothetical protein
MLAVSFTGSSAAAVATRKHPAPASQLRHFQPEQIERAADLDLAAPLLQLNLLLLLGEIVRLKLRPFIGRENVGESREC